MREKYTFNFGTEKLIMSKRLREKRTHIVLKLLAYLYFDRRPSVEKRISRPFRYKPDLALEEKGRPQLWVECAKVSVKKLEKLVKRLPRTDIYLFRKTLSRAKSLRRELPKETVRAGNLTFTGFEEGFVENIAELLRKVNRVGFKKSSDRVSLNINGNSLSSKFFYFKSYP